MSIQRMRNDGMQTIGAGKDIDEARLPAIVEVDKCRVAFLGYCSVAPKSYYAVPGRAGVAPMRTLTHYEPLEEDQPGTPCKTITWPLQRDLDALVEDVQSARRHSDVVAVSLHWGVHHIPVVIADYQPVVAHAAIDAGADLILGHHPHVLKAIEVYRGKVIFYSLGNFAMDSHSAVGKRNDPVWRREVKEEYARFGTSGPGDYREDIVTSYSMAARVGVDQGGIRQVSFIPIAISPGREPEPV